VPSLWALRDRPIWVGWRVEARKGKPTKPPVNPHNGHLASVTQPTQWGTLAQALDALRRGLGRAEGVGVILGAGLCGIDLDHCLGPDGQPNELAADVLSRIETYAEISPSGDGLHLLCWAKQAPEGACRRDGIEIYGGGRYLTVTGDVPEWATGREVAEDATEALAEIHARYVAREQEAAPQPEAQPTPQKRGTPAASPVACPGLTLSRADATLLRQARNQRDERRRERFRALFDRGDWAGEGYPSQSEADAALCADLAFWCRKLGGAEPVRARVDSLFRQSALFRPKWDEQRGAQTYGQRTLDEALSQPTDQAPSLRVVGGVAPEAPDPQPRPQRKWTRVTLADAEAVLGDIEWLWPNWIPLGHISMVVAQAGIGKSTFCLDLLVRAAQGRGWPDGSANEVGPVRVMLADTEWFLTGHIARMRRWGIDRSLVDLPGIGDDGVGALALGDKAHEDLVRESVEGGVRLVVVDSLSGGHAEDENDARTAGLMAPWREIAQTYGVAVVFVHHTRKLAEDRRPKLSDLRGSSAIAAIPRSVIGLWRPDSARDPRRLCATNIKPSLVEADDALPEFGIQIRRDGLEYTVNPLGAIDPDSRKILDALSGRPRPVRALADATGLGREKTTNRLAMLRGMGLVREADIPVNERRQAGGAATGWVRVGEDEGAE